MRRWLLGASVLVLACAREPSTARDRDEAARVLRAIDTLIAANDGEKAAPLALLETTACSEKAACAARDGCVAAFRPLVTSVTLQREVRAAMRAPGAAASVEALESKVRAAEAAQKEAAAKMEGCLRAAGDARKAHRL